MILHFEPSRDALSLRSEVIKSIQILSLVQDSTYIATFYATVSGTYTLTVAVINGNSRTQTLVIHPAVASAAHTSLDVNLAVTAGELRFFKLSTRDRFGNSVVAPPTTQVTLAPTPETLKLEPKTAERERSS